MDVIIFFTVVFAVYISGAWYTWRGLRALLPERTKTRGIFTWVYMPLAATFFAGRVLEGIAQSFVSDALVWIGSFWLGAMLYLFLSVLLIDVFRLGIHFARRIKSPKSSQSVRPKYFTFFGVIAATVILMIAGRVNQRNPVVRDIALTIERREALREELRIAVLTDMHLGTIICSSHVDEIVDEVNRLEPDMVLLVGDILDEDLGPVIRQNLGSKLLSLSTPLGVYGVTGNHEYIGGVEGAVRYLSEHGIVMLRDSAITFSGGFTLVGREDHASERFAGVRRKPLAELLKTTGASLPVILMDHQPRDLDEAADNNVSLQLSGHVHYGQLWPLNYITDAVYELSYGYLRKGGTQYYVSSGVGSWGPPMRIGSRAEILHLRVRFE